MVVAPESFLTAPVPAYGSEQWTRLRSLIEEREVHVLIELPHFARDGQRTQILNAVLHLAPRRWSLYAKERLVPGAEFQPLPHAMHIHRGESPAPRVHVLTLARLRAMEFGKPLPRITNGGASSLVHLDGWVLERARSVEPQRLEWSKRRPS